MSIDILINNIQKAEQFVAIFQHIKVFSESINIMFEEERLFIQSMDASRVSIFEITIPQEWFDKYDVEKNTTIGIHTTMLSSVLNTRDKSQQINIVYNADDDKLYLHFTKNNQALQYAAVNDGDNAGVVASATPEPETKKKAKGKKVATNETAPAPAPATAPAPYVEFDRHFELVLIEMESELMAIPEMEYQAEFSISSLKFANLINQLKIFGDRLDIKCTEEKIVLCSTAKEHGNMAVDITISDLSAFAIEENETVNLSFSLRYLQNILLYAKIAREIKIQISKNCPIRVDYELTDGAALVFYLAPKINDDEDDNGGGGGGDDDD